MTTGATPTGATALLQVEQLRRTFAPDIEAVRDVSLEVEEGRILALLGPSGCGKSTVLRLIAGLEHPDAGDVRIDGHSILGRPPERRGVGLMFQELALFPHLDVFGNVEFGLRMARWERGRREVRVRELLELVGLHELGRRRIDELSGGERQRVALARALAPQPAVLLLDEPLGALDEARKQSLRYELRSLLHAVGTTAVLVSHDLRDAVAIADDLAVMDHGQIRQAGELGDVLRQPADDDVAATVGYVTLLDGHVRGTEVHEHPVGHIALPEGMLVRGRSRVFGHPSALLAVPAGRGLGLGIHGRVIAARPEGPSATLEVDLGPRQLQLRWEWDLEPPAPGAEIEVAARPETLRFFSIPEPDAPKPVEPPRDDA